MHPYIFAVLPLTISVQYILLWHLMSSSSLYNALISFSFFMSTPLPKRSFLCLFLLNSCSASCLASSFRVNCCTRQGNTWHSQLRAEVYFGHISVNSWLAQWQDVMEEAHGGGEELTSWKTGNREHAGRSWKEKSFQHTSPVIHLLWPCATSQKHI